MVRARFQGDVQRGTASEVPGLIQRDDLSVRLARWLRVTLSHNAPVSDQHGADRRVGTGPSNCGPRQRQGT